MVQMNCIDMNAWYSRVDKPHRPDFVSLDLDPPDLDTPGGGFALAIRVAHLIREELEQLELESYVKTSGADGIHLLVPIARRSELRADLCVRRAHCARARGAAPGLVTTEWLESASARACSSTTARTRGGKTIASVYSVRPKPGAPVSTPLRWDELTEDVTPGRLRIAEALEPVERHGDLFAPVLAAARHWARPEEVALVGRRFRSRSSVDAPWASMRCMCASA